MQIGSSNRQKQVLYQLKLVAFGTEFNATGKLKNYDASDRLSRIKVPALYTCGEYDESTPKANKHFASLTPDAEVKVIPEASHTAFLENRKLYMPILREFFARFE